MKAKGDDGITENLGHGVVSLGSAGSKLPGFPYWDDVPLVLFIPSSIRVKRVFALRPVFIFLFPRRSSGCPSLTYVHPFSWL